MLGLKAVTFFPRNEGTDLDSHQGAVLLFEAGRGRLLAMIDATSVTADPHGRRQRAGHARPRAQDAGDLALVGSGVQARTHLEAMLAVRPIRRVRVASQTRARATSFAEREGKRHGVAIDALRLGRGGGFGRRPRLHRDLLARARRCAASGSRPART